MKSLLENSLRFWSLIVFILCINLILVYLYETDLKNDDIVREALSSKISEQNLNKVILRSRERWYLPFFIETALYILSSFLVAGIIYSATKLTEDKILFSILFKICLLTQTIFTVFFAIKIAWFLFFQPSYTLAELTDFVPLSFQNFIDTSQNGYYWAKHFAKMIGLSELLYCLSLIYSLAAYTNKPLSALTYIIISYVAALLLCNTLLTFLTVSF